MFVVCFVAQVAGGGGCLPLLSVPPRRFPEYHRIPVSLRNETTGLPHGRRDCALFDRFEFVEVPARALVQSVVQDRTM